LFTRSTANYIVEPNFLTSIAAFLYYQESSILRANFLERTILVRYVQQCNTKIIEASDFPSNYPDFHAESSSSSASKGRSTSGKIFLGYLNLFSISFSSTSGRLISHLYIHFGYSHFF